jgi:diguanylate cyclase (GGDEF)-like protein
MRFNSGKIANLVMSACAGIAAFIFTLIAFLLLRDIDQQIVASLTIGMFALLIVWVASEKPNSGHARAVTALIERLLAVRSGDLTSPAPDVVKREMPALASAVDSLFEQVRSTIDDVHAMALYDPVTSLPNRLQFKREAERILQAAAADEWTALLFVDLDGFKEVNDSLGHAQGDQVLAMVAARLTAVVKQEGNPGRLSQPLIARLAGDEFTLLFPAIGSVEEAERMAQAVLRALTEPFESGGRIIDMGASIGVAISPRDGGDLTSLMRAADIAMYCAKSGGRSQACLYHPSLAAAFDLRAPQFASGPAGRASPQAQARAVRITRA